MNWRSHHVNAIQNQKVIPVWNSCRSDFSHVNTPSDAYLLLAPDYMISDFHCGTKFVFSPHDTRMKLHTRARISFRLKTGMNSFWLEWLEWELNVTSVSREQVQRNIWRWYELVPEWKSFHQLVNSPLLIVWLSWLHSHLSFRVTQDVLIV